MALQDNIKHSIIDSDVRFSSEYCDMDHLVNFRRTHPEITQMCLITLKPAILLGDPYNPRALIMLILN